MKTIKRLLLVCAFAPTIAMAQVNKTEHISTDMQATQVDEDFAVPQEVKMDFEARYPESEVTNLDATRDRYSIDYTKDNKEYTSYYDTRNNWMETHQSMSYNNLPANAKSAFMGTEYKDSPVESVNLVENQDGNQYYQLTVQQSGASRNLYINTNGKVINKVNSNSPRSSYEVSPGKPGSSEAGDRNRVLNEPNRIENTIDQPRSR